MPEQLTFEADAAIISRIGSELVAKQETALIELIKNSFDADATEVRIVLEQGIGTSTLGIQDNGTGMNRGELVNGFLRLASDAKVRQPRSDTYQRQRAGRKGIGRFATQRLGNKLTLETKRWDEENGLRLSVDWREFSSGRELSEVFVELEEIEMSRNGTLILIEDLKDSWSRTQLRRAWRGVLSLQQPFPIAPVEGSPKHDPGFSVQIITENELFDDESVVADIKTECKVRLLAGHPVCQL